MMSGASPSQQCPSPSSDPCHHGRGIARPGRRIHGEGRSDAAEGLQGVGAAGGVGAQGTGCFPGVRRGQTHLRASTQGDKRKCRVTTNYFGGPQWNTCKGHSNEGIKFDIKCNS